ncbi:MAG: glutaminase domain-containing protein [Brevinematia bacterium]
MNLIADALTVFGSRFGIGINPAKRECYLIKADDIKAFPFELEAGIEVNGKRIYLPLSSDKENFYFHDQKLTPTTMQLSGIDPDSGLHLKLSFMIPFRPKDVYFSTIPVIYIKLKLEKLPNPFRWFGVKITKLEGKIFLRFKSKKFNYEYDKDKKEVLLSYEHIIKRPPKVEGGVLAQLSTPIEEKRKSTDRIAILEGDYSDGEFYRHFDINSDGEILICWANYESPILSVKGKLCEFKYTESFRDVQDVVKWGKENYREVLKNSNNVDNIFLSHNLGVSVSNLMSMTLHSWLYDSWYVRLDDEKDWYSVWEGSCFFHSTIDVEYTQSPFYLSVWPELLELELDEWPLYAKDGEIAIGDRGKGSLFLSHDMGLFANADRHFYPHEMEVEENANYILMAYAHWRRTGNDGIIRKHFQLIKKLMDFILACDTTGNGIVDLCCANTIDDASPAVQFGKEQIYLAVKSMAAVLCGIEILAYTSKENLSKYKTFVSRAKNTIEKEGWKDDHYIVSLTKSADGLVDPWSGKKLSGELEGWDAYHIYTENGLALLEMVGKRIGLSEKRIKEDILNAVKNTFTKYGCRHSSYIHNVRDSEVRIGLASSSNKVGWISMNMLRDIVACYYGIDLFYLAENYWDWQLTTNSQDIYLFFETFYGNNLNLYPRGLAVFGYMEAIAGFSCDRVNGRKSSKPIRRNIEIPIFMFADWREGKVLKIKT